MGLARVRTAILLLIALAGLASLLIVTRSGPGLIVDSLVYMEAASSLASGHGLTVFNPDGTVRVVTLFPPLFPAFLTLLGKVGLEPLDAARWLNAVCFAATIFLVGRLIDRNTEGSLWWSVMGAILILTSFISNYSLALSEPPFIVFTVIGLALVARYIERPSLMSLSSAASIVALACLTRYAGVPLAVAGFAGLLMRGGSRLPRRMTAALAFAFASLLPLGLWLLRNYLLIGAISERPWRFHPITVRHLLTAVDSVTVWLLPLEIPPWVRGISVAVAALGTLWSVRFIARPSPTSRRRAWQPIDVLVVAFVFFYCVFFAAIISFVSFNITFHQRYLFPLRVLAVMLITRLAREFHRAAGARRNLRAVLIALIVVFAGSWVVRGVQVGASLFHDGQGISRRRLREDEIVRRVRELPPRTVVYAQVPANGARPLTYLTARSVRPIPAKFDPHAALPRATYRSELKTMREELRNGRAVLVYMRAFQSPGLPTERELLAELPLIARARTTQGAIYGIGPVPPDGSPGRVNDRLQ